MLILEEFFCLQMNPASYRVLPRRFLDFSKKKESLVDFREDLQKGLSCLLRMSSQFAETNTGILRRSTRCRESLCVSGKLHELEMNEIGKLQIISVNSKRFFLG